jgi:dUTP pyrophosphatase
MKTLKVKKLHPDAILPKYQTAGAACFDLHALEPGMSVYGRHCVVPGGTSVFGTGLAFEVPEGHVMLLYSRSGHGFKNDVRMANCVGVIDSDYRGELRVKLTCDRPFGESGGLIVANGDRIAQGMVLPVEQWAMEEVTELGDTARGEGGYGSTGA